MKKQKINLLLFMKKGKPFFISSQRNLPSLSEQGRLAGPAAGLKQKILGFYNQFKERFDPQETVCSTLHFANQLHIVHPQRISEQEAARILEDFLSKSRKKHSFWMIIDTILAMMGGILTPIPGPNLFFFYPAARAVSHYFARRGVLNAQALQEKGFTTNSLLDSIQDNIDNLEAVASEIDKLENKYGCIHIERLLNKGRKQMEKI